jgi:hypothetical protein
LLVGGQIDPGCPINLSRIEQGPLPRRVPFCPPVARQVAAQAITPIDAVLARVQEKWPDKVALLRVIDFFCESDCPVVRDNLWLYSNRDHLNMAGSKYMIARSEDVFRRFLNDEP